MRRSIAPLLALTASLAFAAAAVAGPLALGAKAPSTDVKMKNVTGDEVTIAGSAGAKGTLVSFTCNACPWAKAWEERIVALGNAAEKKGIGVIAINPNDPSVAAEDNFDEMVKRAEARGMQFPYVVDATSDVARAFGATRTPEAFLFDAKGKLVYHGTIDDNGRQPDQVKNKWLESAVNAVASGKKVKDASTKALGCSIKFRGASAS